MIGLIINLKKIVNLFIDEIMLTKKEIIIDFFELLL